MILFTVILDYFQVEYLDEQNIFIVRLNNVCDISGSRNGIGPCNGDSGSGLIINRNGQWMLRGIVSMSISDSYSRTCDLKNYVVFTDASKFLSWLLSFVK